MNFFTTEVSSKEIETKSIHSENAGAHQIAPQTHTFLTFNIYCRLLANFIRGTVPYFSTIYRTEKYETDGIFRKSLSRGKQFPVVDTSHDSHSDSVDSTDAHRRAQHDAEQAIALDPELSGEPRLEKEEKQRREHLPARTPEKKSNQSVRPLTSDDESVKPGRTNRCRTAPWFPAQELLAN
jgi:hypothetical protein